LTPPAGRGPFRRLDHFALNFLDLTANVRLVLARPGLRFSTPQLTGLRAIGDLPRLARRILVYLGDRQLKTEDGIEVWPFDRFTSAVAARSLWP